MTLFLESLSLYAVMVVPLAIAALHDVILIVRAARVAADSRGDLDEADPDDLIPPPLAWPAPPRAYAPRRSS